MEGGQGSRTDFCPAGDRVPGRALHQMLKPPISSLAKQLTPIRVEDGRGLIQQSPKCDVWSPKGLPF